MSDPLDALYTTPAMAALFAPEEHLRRMLVFEAALARAEARVGIIPQAAAAAIEAGCRDGGFDVAAVYGEAALAGTPAIPLVRMLTARLPVEGRAYLHWGATSQDVIDTATVLQMRDGLTLLETDLLRLGDSCCTLADDHRRTLMAGRTLFQQALPITFGLKAARWLGLVTRQIQVLRGQREAWVLQFGGAAGTLAALGSQGLRVAELLADELSLAVPDLPWHAERDRVTRVAAMLGVTAGAMAKIAGDLVLLGQTEVGEVSEASEPGKGGSSTMPHKRNPVDATLALASARLAIGQAQVLLALMPQEHERGLGNWQAEWSAIPSLFRFAAGAVAHLATAVAGLTVDAGRMEANLEQGGDLLMAESLSLALAPHLGRVEAQHLVRAACAHAAETNQSLCQASLADDRIRAILSPELIRQALDRTRYLGSTDLLIERAIEGYRAVVGGE